MPRLNTDTETDTAELAVSIDYSAPGHTKMCFAMYNCTRTQRRVIYSVGENGDGCKVDESCRPRFVLLGNEATKTGLKAASTRRVVVGQSIFDEIYLPTYGSFRVSGRCVRPNMPLFCC